MAIPDPATFIGKRCVILLKKSRKPKVEKVLSIDTNGVKVERPDGKPHLYQFSEIARMNKSAKEVD